MNWVALPPPPTCHRRVRIGFICTPDFNNRIIGRFHVVRLLEFGEGFQPFLRLEIFSSETREWTDCVISWHKPVLRIDSLCNGSVVCNGMLPWRFVCEDHILASDPYRKVNKAFRTIALPKECCNEARVDLSGDSQGHLRYAEFHQDTFRVWEFEDYSSGEWRLAHKLHQREMVWEDPKLAKYTTLGSCVIFLRVPGHIIECNLRSKSFKSLCSLVHVAVYSDWTIFPYVLPWWPISVPQC